MRLREAWDFLDQDHWARTGRAGTLPRKRLVTGPLPKEISVPGETEEPGSLLPALQAALYPQSRQRLHWQAPPRRAGHCHYGEGPLSQLRGHSQGWRLMQGEERLSALSCPGRCHGRTKCLWPVRLGRRARTLGSATPWPGHLPSL